MNIRAETEEKFLYKYLVIGLVCLGFFLWSAYDSFVKYPGKMPRAEAWRVLQKDDTLDDTARTEKWKVISEEKGWKPKRPTKKETVDSLKQTIFFNYGFMAIGLGIALPCLMWFLKTRGTWIESNESGLENSAGQQCALKQITKIDKRRWQKKGIAAVHYTDDVGAEQVFYIDDLKYERGKTDAIMKWVEENVDNELIVNGELETTTKTTDNDEA